MPYPTFDRRRLQLKPLAQRHHDMDLSECLRLDDEVPLFESEEMQAVADRVAHAHHNSRQVILMMGAHLIKVGLSRVIVDLLERGIITHLAMNGAGVIHDFELALIGETSENVPRALPEGLFGMAYETGKYMNDALAEGHRRGLGYGEAIARMILGEEMPYRVEFRHPEWSVLAAAHEAGVPATVHATIGTDIIDQHANFDGAAKGGCSGRDFGVFAARVCELAGGVVVNVGSAVTMPEVLLKAVSMAANVGSPPEGMVTADFDLRPADPAKEADPSTPGYYYRDLKSVVVRIPRAFGGHGHYIEGNFVETIPQLWTALDGLSGE